MVMAASPSGRAPGAAAFYRICIFVCVCVMYFVSANERVIVELAK